MTRRYLRFVTLLALAAPLVGCGGNASRSAATTASTAPIPAGAAAGTVPVEPVSSAAPGSTDTGASADGSTSTTIAADFGDLGHDGYCAATKKIVDATSALVPSASADDVKSGLATMTSSLGTLADKGAVDQRPRFAAAVAVLNKAAVAIQANGFDVAKTQSQLSVLDPEGALVGAITVVLTQRQTVCSG